MARKKKTLTPLQREYKHQVERIQRAIKREAKKGIKIHLSDFVRLSLTRITRQEIERLRSVTPAKLREKGEVQRDNYSEEIREVEANIKGLEEMMDKYEIGSPMYDTYYTMWQQGRARLDELQKLSLESPTEDVSGLKSASIAMDTLKSEISEIGEIGDGLQSYILNTLQAEVEAYGEEATIGNILALDADFVETTRAVMKYGAQDRQARQIIRLVNAITGTTMSSEEIRELSDLIEKTTPF